MRFYRWPKKGIVVTEMKKVLLVVIDALASRVVRPAMGDGRLPHLRALAESGSVQWNCTAIYGDDSWAIMQRGFATFLKDFLVRLNRDQLRMETIFQTVEHAEQKTACLNYLWFRGSHPHKIQIPWLLPLWPGVPFSKTLDGPSILSLGDFVSTTVGPKRKPLTGYGGMFRRFGFNDALCVNKEK